MPALDLPVHVCRDEDCTIVEVHAPHLVKKREAQVHHRPSTSQRAPWQRPDTAGLTGAIMRATSKAYPMVHASILREVLCDYGGFPSARAARRAVQRHIAKLVDRGCLIRYMYAGTACYVRPKSRIFSTEKAIHEWLLANVELGTDAIRREAI